jgi:hypothetical protein
MAHSQDAHESLLDMQKFALALVLLFSAVGQSFFQEKEVAPEFELP